MPDAEAEKEAPTVHWTNKLETVMKNIGEKSVCYSVLHKCSEHLYSKRRSAIDLPCIILSTISGSISLSSSSLFGEENAKNASIGVGILGLVVGVLNTIGSYFAFGKKAEAHRIAQLEFNKLARYIRIQLSLPRPERTPPGELLKHITQEQERLFEMSPLLPPKIVKRLKAKYKHLRLSKPDELNSLEGIEIYYEGVDAANQPSPAGGIGLAAAPEEEFVVDVA
jgi:hypothetical protein